MAKDQFRFDIVSEVALPEVATQWTRPAARSAAVRLQGNRDLDLPRRNTIERRSSTEDRLKAAVQVLKEKVVKRGIPLKALSEGPVQPAAKGHLQAERARRDRHLGGQGQGHREVT